jgi:hypothetical protein
MATKFTSSARKVALLLTVILSIIRFDPDDPPKATEFPVVENPPLVAEIQLNPS